MDNSSIEMAEAIQLSASAAGKVQELVARQGGESALLRVYIQPDGG
jgi:Fe-S cluster assembly iron-binding protein IscA